MSEKLTVSGKKSKRLQTLRRGESQHCNGGYQYRWTDSNGKRHSIHTLTLEELREKEAAIAQDQYDKIKPEARNVTINEMFELWKQIKRGLKDNTFQDLKKSEFASFEAQWNQL